MNNIKSKKHRTTLTVLLIILLASAIWVYWGNISIQITHIGINSKKIPIAFNGFRIVQVSDLHNAEFGDNQSKLLRAIKAASPDLIAVTGDLIDSRHTDVEKAMDFIEGALDIAQVYFVSGNHEARTDKYAELKERMMESGVILLEDESATIKFSGDTIRLLGLKDLDFSGIFRENTVMIDTKLKDMRDESGKYTVLLSHRPELFEVYTANGIDLVLSGHAHGGQVRLPFVGGLVAPNQGFFPKYSEGVYEKQQTKMIVSRGLGNSIVPVRLNNRPELVMITFVSV
ncbi:MAG: metallophosphoesterase [Clostridia bacterium]|jgi:predicted MPP superfamily phosphohydrolase|nr:metallophosphoesterase [Clostridia bacterium]